MTPPEVETSQWMAAPEVMIPGDLGRRLTISTDGLESRVIERSSYDPDTNGGAGWPQSRIGQPWLQTLPLDLMKGQSLVTDGERGHIKEKPEYTREREEEENAEYTREVPPTTPTPTPSASPTPPPTPTPTPPITPPVTPPSSTPMSSAPDTSEPPVSTPPPSEPDPSMP